MQWSELLGHRQQQDWFRTALASGRLATSFLFVGSEGIGKRTFARLLAKGLLCRGSEPASLDSCGCCEDCTQVEADTHPDLIAVSKPPDKAVIPLELLIGEREKRMREGLCYDISLRPYGGRRKIAIVDDADYFNAEGANCLLKTLEEPPPNSVLILLGTSLQRQLPTIRSRCQAIIFQPLSNEQVETLLLRHGVTDSAEQARQLACQSGGSLAEALLLADPEVDQFRASLLATLSKPQLPLVELAKSCGAIVDAAGKDARIKRERMKLIFRLAASFYREMSLRQCAQESGRSPIDRPGMEPLMLQAVDECNRSWKTGSRGATGAWNRCLEAMQYVDRNANQATLLEAWSAEIARLGGR